ncbi:MAG: ribosome maturation factor RimM [Oscillospiraceae bacterium]|jgi:16S rRNA processing protein RimM|nr:ribosome maturation factor RimM [Oscillospiraceae bacterium]
MRAELLETGEIVNIHGVRGEVKVKPWANGPEALLGLGRLYIDGEPLRVASARAHGGAVIIAFEGVTGAQAAAALRGKTVWLNRSDVVLAAGERFVADLVGMRAVDADGGHTLGYVYDVMKLPMNDVYVIRRDDGSELLVPSRPEFVREIDSAGGAIYFTLIEGMK